VKSWWKPLVGIGLIVLVLANQKPARCEEYVVMTVRSYHLDRNKGYNEQNWGLGYERKFSDEWSFSSGYYRNSFDRDTLYVFGAYTPWRIAGWRFGSLFGVVTGYDEGRVSPWITGVATKEWGRFGLNVVVAPAAVALQVKWRLE